MELREYGKNYLQSHESHEKMLINRGMLDDSLVIISRLEWEEACKILNELEGKINEVVSNKIEEYTKLADSILQKWDELDGSKYDPNLNHDPNKRTPDCPYGVPPEINRRGKQFQKFDRINLKPLE
jgi:hypothetical protein